MREKFNKYEAHKNQIEEQIEKLDSFSRVPSVVSGQPPDIAAPVPASEDDEREARQTAALIAIRNQLQQDLSTLKPPVFLDGFYLSRLMLVWPMFYICLGLVTFLLPPREKPLPSKSISLQIKGALPILAFLFPLFRWPTWGRNIMTYYFNNEKRVVYAWANCDVGVRSFFTQEVQALGIAFLVALLWRQWLSFHTAQQKQLKKEFIKSNRNILEEALDPFRLQRLSTLFFRWQVSSVFLVLAFIGYTDFFWNYIVVVGDRRYLANAIVVHAVWAISWAIISRPLFITWYAWHSIRARAISALVLEPAPENVNKEIALKALSELRPIGFLNLTASGVLVVISFVLPIVQTVYR